METVDVFVGLNGHQHFAAIDLMGQWRLHQNAIYFRAFVKTFDDAEQITCRDVGWGRDFFTVDAEIRAGFYFIADVYFGARVVADEDDGESGRPGEPCYAGSQALKDSIADQFSV